jgi:hypothetical protein
MRPGADDLSARYAQFILHPGGPADTDEMLRPAKRSLEELGIRRVLISTARGFTPRRFLEIARPATYDKQ